MRRCWLTLLALTGCEKLFSLAYVDYTPPPDAPPCEPRSVATGRAHSCAIDHGGDVYCWGENSFGQVTPSSRGIVLAPTRVVLPGPAVQVAAGRQFNCAR